MADKNPRIQARLTNPDLAAWLITRSKRMHIESINVQAVTELGMWRTVLEIELSRIRLTLAQANCIADVIGGWAMNAAVGVKPGLVYGECYDTFRLARETGGDISSYGAKHGPEGSDPAKWEQDLLDYLGGLGPAADHALRDAISRWWWHHPGEDGDVAQQVARFASVGLRVTP